jgi:hypothetical protein
MENASEFRHVLIGYALASEFAGKRDNNLRALKALAAVQARAASVGDTPAEREAAARDIQATLTTAGLDASTFASLPKAMAGHDDLFTIDPSAWAKGLGLGMRVGGIVAGRILQGVLSPAGAVALQLAGVLTEPTLTYLADHAGPGRDLTLGPILPPADTLQLQNLTQWAFQKSLSLLDSDPELRRFVADPVVKLHVGFDLGVEPNSVVRDLPPAVQSAISRALNRGLEDMRNDVATQQQVIDDLRNDVVNAYGQLKSKVDVIETLLREELGERERARVMQQAHSALEYTTSEVGGAGALGAALLTHVIGDQQAAKIFQASVNAVGQAYHAIGLFELKQIGSLMLAGSLVGAATLLMNVLQPAPDQLILKALEQINGKLDAMAATLDRIERQQSAIRQEIAKLFAEIRGDARAARTMLTTIQGQLNEVIEDVNINARAADETSYGMMLDQCQSLLRQPAARRADAAWTARYNEFLTAFYSYATRVAKQPAFTGDPTQPLDFARVRDLIQTRRRADLVFGAVPRIADLVGIGVPLGEPIPTGDTLPNPLTWAEGVNAYLEARTLAQEIPINDDHVWLPLLWKEGLRLRAAAQAAGSYRSVRAAVNAFRTISGIDVASNTLGSSPTLLGCVQRSIAGFEATQFISRYSVTQRDRQAPNGGETVYSTGDFFQTLPIRVDPDPFDLAVQRGIIDKQAAADGSWNASGITHDRFACRLVLRVGPQQGQLLLGKMLYEHRFSGAKQGIFRCWNPSAPDGDGSDPRELLDECTRLLHAYLDYPKLQADFPGILQRDLTAAALVQFEGLGRIVQLFVTIARWRQMQFTVEPLSTQITSMPGIVTIEQVVAFVRDYLKQDLSNASSWVLLAVEALRSRLNEDATWFLDVSDGIDPNQKILIIDETMRRLGGFMRTMGIDIPLPVVATGSHPAPDAVRGNRILSAFLAQ